MRPLWVIGGTSGIGAATVEIAGEMDRHTMVSGENQCDVREELDIQKAWDYFLKSFEYTAGSRVEVVYSAGINRLDMFGAIDPTDMSDVFDVNVMGFIRVMDIMARSHIDDIRVVVVSSDAAVRPMRGSVNYCASKAALDMAVKCAAREMGPRGWRINAVSPGMTAPTGMSDYIDERVPELRGWSRERAADYELRQSVIPRRATPYEVGSLIMQTLEAPDYLNGSIITINGGR